MATLSLYIGDLILELYRGVVIILKLYCAELFVSKRLTLRTPKYVLFNITLQLHLVITCNTLLIQ